MSVYIESMELPKEGFVEVLIRDDGTVQQTGQSYRIGGTDYYTPYVGEMPAIYKAVTVPPHGRLGDLDKLERGLRHMAKYQHGERQQGILGCCETIRLASTILPAEEGET